MELLDCGFRRNDRRVVGVSGWEEWTAELGLNGEEVGYGASKAGKDVGTFEGVVFGKG